MSADLLVTWLGAAGVAAYLVHVHRRRSRSFLESRTLLLLYCIASLLAVRGFFWLQGGSVLRVLTLLPATFLPLAATLFTEALLRRHAPLALKLWVAVGTPVLLLSLPFTASAPWRGHYFRALSIFMVVTFLALVSLLLWRRRSDLAPAENALADAVTVAAGLAVAVALTDFRWRPDWLDLRLGGLGGLFFVYACVRLSGLAAGPGAGWRLAGETAWLVLKTAALSLAMVVMLEVPSTLWPAVAAVALAFVLLFAILDRLRRAGRGGGWVDLRRWFLTSDLSSPERVRAALRRLPWAEHHLVLDESDLADYDPAVLLRAFGDGAEVPTLARVGAGVDDLDRDAAEQLAELLRSFDMSQAAVLRHRPLLLLLVQLPDVALAEGRLEDVAFLARACRTSLGRVA